MLLAGSSQDGTPLILVNMPAQTPQRPVFRRRNQHLFNQIPPTPVASEPSTPGPSQVDDKPGYFSCLSCVTKVDLSMPVSENDHLCSWAVIPSFENPTGEGGLFSDTARPDRDALFEDHLDFNAAFIRLMLQLPSKVSAGAPILQIQQEIQAPEVQAPDTQAFIDVVPQRRFYSFSSSDSEVSSFRHVEDVENPAGSYFEGSMGGPVIERVMTNLTLRDSGIDISDPTIDASEAADGMESKRVVEDGLVVGATSGSIS
jgi:hypothetical protein